MYSITLSDGTVLPNLEIHGNNYVANAVLVRSDIEDKLDSITITDGEGHTETETNQAIYYFDIENGKTWFVLGDKTEEMRMRERISELETVNTELELALTEVYELIIGG